MMRVWLTGLGGGWLGIRASAEWEGWNLLGYMSNVKRPADFILFLLSGDHLTGQVGCTTVAPIPFSTANGPANMLPDDLSTFPYYT
ncbi:hypothetical protein QBC39DRAFT_356746 [Podospora conica]|nr:hypothetical protein QBC39DRAFT_356746 [Schizothecium conicum]